MSAWGDAWSDTWGDSWGAAGAVDQVAIQMPKTRFREGDNFTAIAHFRRSKAVARPATVHYRVDCLTNQKQITDWTEVSTGTTADIPIVTAIRRDFNRTERKRLTVAADMDTDNQVIGTTHWIVVNLAGIR